MGRVIYTIEQARQIGLDNIEKEALRALKELYKGKWSKAVIKADVVDNNVIYEVIR